MARRRAATTSADASVQHQPRMKSTACQTAPSPTSVDAAAETDPVPPPRTADAACQTTTTTPQATTLFSEAGLTTRAPKVADDDDGALTMVERRPYFETSDEELEGLAMAARAMYPVLGTSEWDEDLQQDCQSIIEGITLDGHLPLVMAYVQSVDVVMAKGVYHPTTNNYRREMYMAPEDVMNLSYATNMMTFTCLFEEVFRMMGRVPYVGPRWDLHCILRALEHHDEVCRRLAAYTPPP
jgi:hypothetical protein